MQAEDFRIGVTGHRVFPDGDVDRLRGVIGDLLACVRDTVKGRIHDSRVGGLRLVVVSALAEGADRFVAEEGLALGFGLDAYLPFPAEEYRRDFETLRSQAEFESLLESANAVQVSDVTPAADQERNVGYRRAGEDMLDVIDLLVAIWNGEPAKGEGGTGHVILLAAERDQPVLWINSRTPHDLVVIQPNGSHHEGHPAAIEAAVNKRLDYRAGRLPSP